MPQDLPGFYFDTEKNRYFPIKGPIPGLKRNDTSEKCKKQNIKSAKKINKTKNLELVKLREVFGSSIVPTRNVNRCNFVREYEKLQASHPQVWKYQKTSSVAYSALELMHGILQTAKGLKEACYLVAGSTVGPLRFYLFDNVGQPFNFDNVGHLFPPISAWQAGTKHEAVGSIWSLVYACLPNSWISCIRRLGRESLSSQRALVTCLGSSVPGSVEIIDLSEPFEFSNDHRFPGVLKNVKSCDATIWTADCSWNGRHAVIGTNRGADLIDLETTSSSRIYYSKSDIFSQQYDNSGNIVLNGLRNGSIVIVDVREKQSGSSESSSRNPAALASIRTMKHQRKFQKKSEVIPLMTSSVCSLVALQSDDQYFLGSSMDGSINLFDRRLLQRGAIQSYEGHTNSHSHLQLSVNPSETLVLSGGEDEYTRIWSIKTGDLIFEEKVSDSVIGSSCWSHGCFDNSHGKNHSWGAWLGSSKGLYYMHGS